MEKQNSVISTTYPPGSFPRIFWEQQLKVASSRDKRGMRWHPVMIKWALYLHQVAVPFCTVSIQEANRRPDR